MDDFLRAVYALAPTADRATAVETIATRLGWPVETVRETAEDANEAGWVTVDEEFGTGVHTVDGLTDMGRAYLGI